MERADGKLMESKSVIVSDAVRISEDGTQRRWDGRTPRLIDHQDQSSNRVVGS